MNIAAIASVRARHDLQSGTHTQRVPGESAIFNYTRWRGIIEPRFRDRADAGRQLAAQLLTYANRPDVLILALPRGGVPVAFEVAQALHTPLDVFLVRKLGMPGFAELALGALASGGMVIANAAIANPLGLRDRLIASIAARERRTLERREQAYRGDRPPPDVRNKTVILVDDGLATGTTMRAAVAALRAIAPRLGTGTPRAVQRSAGSKWATRTSSNRSFQAGSSTHRGLSKATNDPPPTWPERKK